MTKGKSTMKILERTPTRRVYTYPGDEIGGTRPPRIPAEINLPPLRPLPNQDVPSVILPPHLEDFGGDYRAWLRSLSPEHRKARTSQAIEVQPVDHSRVRVAVNGEYTWAARKR